LIEIFIWSFDGFEMFDEIGGIGEKGAGGLELKDGS
jgi:hypothetical protein